MVTRPSLTTTHTPPAGMCLLLVWTQHVYHEHKASRHWFLCSYCCWGQIVTAMSSVVESMYITIDNMCGVLFISSLSTLLTHTPTHTHSPPHTLIRAHTHTSESFDPLITDLKGRFTWNNIFKRPHSLTDIQLEYTFVKTSSHSTCWVVDKYINHTFLSLDGKVNVHVKNTYISTLM